MRSERALAVTRLARIVCAGWVLCACLFAPAALADDDDLARVRQQVASVPVLRGEFVQEKRISGFSRPLRSSGTFLVARGKGVAWKTLAPFPSEMVVTGDRILSRQRDGTSRVEVDGREQPALRGINAAMLALVNGDVDRLSSQFDVQASAPAGAVRWTLLLVPKSRALARAFARIELEGGRHVRVARIVEAGGDTTVLSFDAISEAPPRLSSEEAGRFD